MASNIYKKTILHKALIIWKNDGGGKTSADILKAQMGLYKNYEPPYDDNFVETVDTVSNWWNTCDLPRDEAHIKTLALKLHAIIPHNATVERIFSVLNWYMGKRRTK